MPSGERHARCTRHEHALGEWMRVRRPPDARLAGVLLDRELLGHQHSQAHFGSWLELTDGFHRQVGLPPKTVGRLLRFAHVRRQIQQAPLRWSDVAYADQSHLNREFRDLAGTTPHDFVRRLIPEGGVVGDGQTPAI